jgi:hypothetical protein
MDKSELDYWAKVYASTYKKEPTMDFTKYKTTEYKKIKQAKLIQGYGLVVEFEDGTISVSGNCTGVVLSKDALSSDPDRLIAKALFGDQTVTAPTSNTERKAQIFDKLLTAYRNPHLNLTDTQDIFWEVLEAADFEFLRVKE